jgi:2-C-methyl-D-erythritol 2,4-cyclodiphosphate synthase
MTIRIGQGFDVHAFEEGRQLVLGGVTIPHSHGLAGHSDADVLIHAVCDALLGAGGLGDIGRHFPDDDAAYKNVDSRVLLRRVMAQLRDLRFTVGNIDVTVIAQAPKLAPYIESMQQHLSEDLQITPEQVNIKATTTEMLGFTGRQEGIAAMAVALLQQD